MASQGGKLLVSYQQETNLFAKLTYLSGAHHPSVAHLGLLHHTPALAHGVGLSLIESPNMHEQVPSIKCFYSISHL